MRRQGSIKLEAAFPERTPTVQVARHRRTRVLPQDTVVLAPPFALPHVQLFGLELPLESRNPIIIFAKTPEREVREDKGSTVLQNCRVPICEGTLLVFSNYQMVHRVLRMVNNNVDSEASRDDLFRLSTRFPQLLAGADQRHLPPGVLL